MFSSFELTVSSFSVPFVVIFFVVFMVLVHDMMSYSSVKSFFSSEMMGDSFFFNTQNLTNIFFMVFFMNYFSLVPYGFGFTALQGTIFLAWSSWVSLFFYLVFKRFNSNISHFLPVSSPTALVFFLVWVEFLSVLARPLALGVRLAANITAGHLLLHLSTHGVMAVGYSAIFLFSMVIALVVLELGVAFIQSYVFTTLLMMYSKEGSE